MERFEPFVLLGKTAEAGGVDHKQDLSLVLTQRLRGIVLEPGKRLVEQPRAIGCYRWGEGKCSQGKDAK